jgi:hypothetical protein
VTEDELSGIYGELYPYSEHKVGTTITFTDSFTEEQHTGVIIWIIGPGPRVEGGADHSAAYVMDILDKSTGMPYTVSPADVLR